MKAGRKNIGNGAALIVVMLMALLLSIIATSFVNFQILERKMSHNEVNDLKAFMMADSGISYALCHICRDKDWQGAQAPPGVPLTKYQWVYQEGAYLYGFRVDCYYNAFHEFCPYSYVYLVRSAGVVYDTNSNRCISKRCVRAIVQCTNDYNLTHWNPTSLVINITLAGGLATCFSGMAMTTALTFSTVQNITTIEINARPDQCHFTCPPGTYGTKAFLLRYYDENQ
ncbi:MAG: PilX N-terminal domain-containing pilus assembly protein [Vulcanimicrobiota bacterium]